MLKKRTSKAQRQGLSSASDLKSKKRKQSLSTQPSLLESALQPALLPDFDSPSPPWQSTPRISFLALDPEVCSLELPPGPQCVKSDVPWRLHPLTGTEAQRSSPFPANMCLHVSSHETDPGPRSTPKERKRVANRQILEFIRSQRRPLT